MSKINDLKDLCETAWGIIVNAHGGYWEDANADWQNAATQWRDRWHKTLPKTQSAEEKVDERI